MGETELAVGVMLIGIDALVCDEDMVLGSGSQELLVDLRMARTRFVENGIVVEWAMRKETEEFDQIEFEKQLNRFK